MEEKNKELQLTEEELEKVDGGLFRVTSDEPQEGLFAPLNDEDSDEQVKLKIFL